jgi:hypothetical protein
MRRVYFVLKDWYDVQRFFTLFSDEATQDVRGHGKVTLLKGNWHADDQAGDIDYLLTAKIKRDLTELFATHPKGGVAILVNTRNQIKEIVFYHDLPSNPTSPGSHKVLQRESNTQGATLTLVAYHRSGFLGRFARKTTSTTGRVKAAVEEGASKILLTPGDGFLAGVKKIEELADDKGGGAVNI